MISRLKTNAEEDSRKRKRKTKKRKKPAKYFTCHGTCISFLLFFFFFSAAPIITHCFFRTCSFGIWTACLIYKEIRLDLRSFFITHTKAKGAVLHNASNEKWRKKLWIPIEQFRWWWWWSHTFVLVALALALLCFNSYIFFPFAGMFSWTNVVFFLFRMSFVFPL